MTKTIAQTSMLIGATNNYNTKPQKSCTRAVLDSYKTANKKIHEYFEEKFGASERTNRTADLVNMNYNYLAPFIITGAVASDLLFSPEETTKKIGKKLSEAYQSTKETIINFVNDPEQTINNIEKNIQKSQQRIKNNK